MSPQGKTTVAQELSKKLPGPLIHIEGDKFWPFLAKARPGESSKKFFHLMMRSITASSTPFVREGYNVLIDFSFPPRFLQTLRAQRERTQTSERLHYIILRPSLEVCKRRAADRPEGTITDYTTFLKLYDIFEEHLENTVSDDEANAVVLADRILQGIREGKFLIP